ncbi:MAG: Zn-dependent alcohol dehydrogenase [Chloroflexi bacterium]|nr:Zn-dependent alcohol dehydrogenase [Chloroflexota bacterium]
MKMRAAVVYEKNKPMRIEEVTLDDPKADEVMVKMVATGLCHTDWHACRGASSPPLPTVLGHEGAGIVEKVGSSVTALKPGDHVITFAFWSCGKCAMCASGQPNYCMNRRTAPGELPSGGKRLHNSAGQDINHYFTQSSFAEYLVCYERQAIKIREDAPLDVACVLACGATTGIGQSLNMAGVRAGQSVAIYGCGGVGLSALLGAKLAGAHPIIAVDVLADKLRLAKDLGANYTINASTEDPVKRIQEITGVGVDHALECIGNVKALEQAFLSQRPLGKCVVVGVFPPDAKIPFAPSLFLGGRTLSGGVEGNIVPSIDLPKFVNLYMEGKLPLDKLVTRRITLDQIDAGFDAMERGEVIRSVIKF